MRSRDCRLLKTAGLVMVILLTVLMSMSVAQYDPAEPGVGIVAITPVVADSAAVVNSEDGKVDFRVEWELCTDGEGDDTSLTSERYRAYFWNSHTLIGEAESDEDLPPTGADSSALIEGTEYTFRDKPAHEQSYFMIKGILTGQQEGDSSIVFSPVSMNIFPTPGFIPASILTRLIDWVSGLDPRTTVFVVIIAILFLIGVGFGWGSVRTLSAENILPDRGTNAKKLMELITGDGQDEGSDKRKVALDALQSALNRVDTQRAGASNDSEQRAQETAGYQIADVAVKLFLSGANPQEIESAVESQIEIELRDLRGRSRIDWIWNVGYVEPLWGLLGTVTGLSKAFAERTADRDTDMFIGINEALITTICGLTAGIILVLLYNLRDRRFQTAEGAIQRLGAELVRGLRK